MSGYIGPAPVPQATQTREAFTATSGQTTFNTGGYTAGYIDVFLNGVKLAAADYTATNGSDVVLATGAATGDILETVAYTAFTVADQDFTGDLTVDGSTFVVDSTNNRVGIGTSSPGSTIHANNTTGDTTVRITSSDSGYAQLFLGDQTSGSQGRLEYYNGNNSMGFYTAGSTRMTLDSSGNLMVGRTSPVTTSSSTDVGHDFRPSGAAVHYRSGSAALFVGRQSSNGDMAVFYKGGSVVGAIGNNSSTGGIEFYGGVGGGIACYTNGIAPVNGSGSYIDNSKDVGSASVRWDDVYATNGTIQTSDRNEKQQIASLTDAEITAAKAISKLFKTFKWNDSVTEKGDAARTHTGVIAQEVEQAMTDAGLNAGDYAFFINTTWWETQTEVPAVEADEENGVEAQEAYTRTDTYDTAEEAPEGATERNRKGIRYPQLLSFVAAATEQRLASIEARLDALESN